jgi:polysaccharide export outer membrane protein
MFKPALVAVTLLLGAVVFPAAAQDEKAIPQELIQYVRDARKAGLKPNQIALNAIQAGWPEATVEAAVGKSEAAPAAAPPEAKAPETPKEAVKDPGGTPPPKPAVQEPATSAKAPDAQAAPGADPSQPRGDDYVIGEGDVLQISVWGEATASVPVATVRTDGKISMPLIKEVQAAGLTPAQVEKSIQEQLGKIIRMPDVTVIVAQINSKKIYLTGAVKKEGPLKFTYRMTVLQAISEAGGLTDYAKRKEIYVLHTESGRQFKLPFNYNAVLKGEHMEQNILLSPGDTIVVP